MSGEPYTGAPIPLMSAVKARNIARAHKALADVYAEAGETRRSNVAQQESMWWLSYAISLSQTPPGRVDDNGL